MEAKVQFPLKCPKSPIFSITTSQPRSLADFCRRCGFLVRPVVPPTVPVGTERVRVCLHAGNKAADVDLLVKSIETWILSTANMPLEPRL